MFRYKLQDFISISETHMMELAKTSWLDRKSFEEVVHEMASNIVLEEGPSKKKHYSGRRVCAMKNVSINSHRKTLLVPALVGHPGQKCLRIKTISKEKCHTLHKSKKFEWVDKGDTDFFLAMNPRT